MPELNEVAVERITDPKYCKTTWTPDIRVEFWVEQTKSHLELGKSQNCTGTNGSWTWSAGSVDTRSKGLIAGVE